MTYSLVMRMRVWIVVVCFCLVLVAMVTADSDDLVTFQVDSHGGLSFPQLPSPTDGNALQRKILDSQPSIFKTSDRLLHEAEISRDAGNKVYEEFLLSIQQDQEKLGHHYSIETLRDAAAHSPQPPPASSPHYQLWIDAQENWDLANRQYDAALAATADDDYGRQAKIFESSSSMYATEGNTKAQEQVENAALAAHARTAAESLPLPGWMAVAGLFWAYALIAKKRG